MSDILQKLFSIETEYMHKVIKILGIKIKINVSQNNKIYVIKNGKRKEVKNIKNLNIKMLGNNNTVTVEKPCKFNNLKITIKGNNNSVHFKSTENSIENLTINMSKLHDNRTVKIGHDFSCVKVHIDVWGEDTTISIGNDCMFSKNIFIRSSDAHKIFNKKDMNNPINKAWGCTIGNHVWCGHGVYIGKNVKIADNTIIGEASVVTKSFEKEYTAIAGQPAKVIKENVTWARDPY